MGQQQITLVEQAADIHRKLSAVPHLAGCSEREIVQRVLHLAGDPTDNQKVDALFTTILSHGPKPHLISETISTIGKTGIRESWNAITEERKLFRSQVELIANDRNAARKKLKAAVDKALGDVVLIPMLHAENWTIKYDLHFYALNVTASCAFAIAMLLDESKEFGNALRKCKLPLCPNFFLSLATGKGGRPPLYCSTEHQTFSANAGSAGRKRRQRSLARKAK